MSKIITYKNEGPNGVYCQLKLDNNERVLISIGDGVVKIFRLFAWMIPTKTIWGPKTIAEASIFACDEKRPVKTLLDAMINKVSVCSSIRDIQKML